MQLQKQQSYQKSGQTYPHQTQYQLSQQQRPQYHSTNNMQHQFNQYSEYNYSTQPNMMISSTSPTNIIQQNSQQNQYKQQNNQINRFAPHPDSFVSSNQKDKNGSSFKQNKSGSNNIQHNQNIENYLNDGKTNLDDYNNSGHSNSYQEAHQSYKSSGQFSMNQQQYNDNKFNYSNHSNNLQSQQGYGQQSQQQQNYFNMQQNNQMKGQISGQFSQQQNLMQQQQQFRYQQQLQEQQYLSGLNQSSSFSSANSCYQNQQQQQSRYKTHKCRHFLSGNCNLGDRCNFAHNDKELRDPQDPLPQNVQVGQKVQITNYKTIKCRYYDNGFCKNSEKCSFAHGNLELLTPGVTLNNVNAFPQQNQLQINELQQEQMRRESIEQQNNSEYLKSNMYDVIGELKQSFPNNCIALKQLEEVEEYLNKGQLIQAHKGIFDLFNNSTKTTQEKQHMLSIVKRLNEYYKGIMETKYKSDQSGFNQSSFFQQISFDGFSLEFQNTYMNDITNNSICDQINNTSESQQENSKIMPITINSNQNINTNIPQQGNYNFTNNNNNNQYHSNSNCSSKSEQHSQGSQNKIGNSPENQSSNIWYQNKSLYSNINTGNEEKVQNQKDYGFEEFHDNQDSQTIQDLNKNFKNLNFGDQRIYSNNEGQFDHIDNEMVQKKNQIQEIFSQENSNLVLNKNTKSFDSGIHNSLEDKVTNEKKNVDNIEGNKKDKYVHIQSEENQNNSKMCSSNEKSEPLVNEEISTNNVLKKQQQ